MAPRYLGGHNAVVEALRAGFPVFRLYLASGTKPSTTEGLLSAARERGVPTVWAERRSLDLMDPEHHGVVAEVGPFRYAEVEALLAEAKARREKPLLLLLDGIQDPHNLGSLLRTAEVVGVHGAIISEHRAVGVTPAVVRASAGAVFHLRVAQVTNLPRTIEGLKERGVWVIALEADGPESYDQVDYGEPTAIVVGSEGRGLGRLVRERCDRLVHLPMVGKTGSLNAAVAGAIVMYHASRQRQRARSDN
jgi:23S rRNA (guanosine2251-2'-O)-methyltransferase